MGSGNLSSWKGALVGHVLAALLIVLAPIQLWLGEPIWEAGGSALAQAVGLGTAYLFGALLARVARGDSDKQHPLIWLAVSLAPLGVFYFVLMVLAPPYSRAVLILASGCCLLFLAGSRAAQRYQAVTGTLMGSTLIAIVVLGFVGGPNVEAGPDVSVARTIQLMTTNRHIIRSTDYRQVLPTNVGGGLGRLGEDILLVTGEGAFWRIRLAGDSIADLEPLNLRAPFNREEFVANADPEIPRDNFRISGLLVQPVGDRSRIVISHNHWNADEECFTVRFSETILGDVELRPEVASNGADAPSWRTLHETRPCLPFRGRRFAGIESGGRIAPLGDTAIIVTVGDYEFDGVNDERALAQSADNDYGKTLIIPLDGGPVRVFTLGHRNPMGLLVAPGGEIWATENGPEGGDELNLLAEGANYGWPLQTFGTQYNELTWPLEDESSPHPEFTLPVFSWVPSISVTNLITLERGGFPRWGDDLLVASLRERSLYRLHREGGRIVYSEPIPVQRRIRDLVETVDGRLVLWADGGSLVILSSADDELGLSPRDEGIEYTP